MEPLPGYDQASTDEDIGDKKVVFWRSGFRRRMEKLSKLKPAAN